MKRVVLFFVFCAAIFPARANKIDELKTNADVETFVHKIDSGNRGFSVPDNPWSSVLSYDGQDYKRIADSLHTPVWEKTDFNNDAQSDLLINGTWDTEPFTIAVISDRDSFRIHHVTLGSFNFPLFPRIDTLESQVVLILNPPWVKKGYYRAMSANMPGTDTLVFQFDGFIELKKSSATHHIEKIEYKTGACFGPCPIFSLEIPESGKAVFNAQHFNDTTGIFTAVIDTASFNRLVTILNYIDFTHLDSSYMVSWTDDQDCTLIVTYDGGKTKTIYDYGLIGTYGLRILYRELFDLRKTQQWTKT